MLFIVFSQINKLLNQYNEQQAGKVGMFSYGQQSYHYFLHEAG